VSSGDVFDIVVTAIIAGSLLIVLTFWRFFIWKEKQLDSETRLAAEKAAQYAASNAQLEQRVRVLEQIVTDAGAETAAQIEALRDKPVPIENRNRSQEASE
jgi:hypothetical protein